MIVSKILDKLQGKVPKGSKRSKQWKKIRKHFLEKNPVCEVCGGKTKLEVHHIIPFHIQPSLELDYSNLITLCEGSKVLNCHLFIGHLGHYRSYNLEVRSDSRTWQLRMKTRPLVKSFKELLTPPPPPASGDSKP